MGDTSIQWTDKTWNPMTGCTKVSAGCANCYAERLFPRVYGKDRKFTDVQFHPDRLEQPLRWRKPRRVFVNSMSDLFHENVPDYSVDLVFAAMAAASWHTFQVLTKRADRMRDYCTSAGTTGRIVEILAYLQANVKGIGGFKAFDKNDGLTGVSFNNVWLGVSVEDQKTANERIPLLLATPAAVRWVSAEPLLGEIDFKSLSHIHGELWNVLTGEWRRSDEYFSPHPYERDSRRLDWIVVGGESGPRKVRGLNLEWARSVIGQCKEAGVPVFVKQLGRYPYEVAYPAEVTDAEAHRWMRDHWTRVVSESGEQWNRYWGRRTDPKGGDPSGWPEDLRVMEFPA